MYGLVATVYEVKWEKSEKKQSPESNPGSWLELPVLYHWATTTRVLGTIQKWPGFDSRRLPAFFTFLYFRLITSKFSLRQDALSNFSSWQWSQRTDRVFWWRSSTPVVAGFVLRKLQLLPHTLLCSCSIYIMVGFIMYLFFHVGFVQRMVNECLVILSHGKRLVVCCTWKDRVEWLGKSSEATFQFGFVLYRPKSWCLGSRLQRAQEIMDSYRLKIRP